MIYVDYVPKMFVDKSENEQINALKEKMRHALVAGDPRRLELCLTEAEPLNQDNILEKEIQYCK